MIKYNFRYNIFAFSIKRSRTVLHIHETYRSQIKNARAIINKYDTYNI